MQKTKNKTKKLTLQKHCDSKSILKSKSKFNVNDWPIIVLKKIVKSKMKTCENIVLLIVFSST